MKRILFAVALSALIAAGCSNKKEVVITGQVTGNPDSKTLKCAVPLSGTSYLGFADTINPDEAGHFELKFKIDKPVFLTVWTAEPYVFAKLLIEPGNNHHIDMDISQKNIQISGASEKGQMLYTALPNPSFIEMEAGKLNLLKDTSLVSIHNKIEDLKQSDISNFKALLDNKEISETFFNLIKIDRDCYYASMEARVSVIKIYTMFRAKQLALSSRAHLLDNLAAIYAQYPPNDEKLLFSSFWKEYAGNYVEDYKQYIREDFDNEKIRELYALQTINTFYIDESKKYLTGKALELFQATHIYSAAFQHDHEKELIALYAQFVKDYPESEYSKYIKPEIDEIAHYHHAIEKPFDSTVRFVDNYENITTLEEAIKPFRGKKIYIDIWATWCGPCKREFKHQKALKEILAGQDIQQLYISTDRDEYDQRWKDAIKFYDLSGSHLRAGKQLAMDLYKRFDRNAETPYMSIPWYMLVDEEGNIIDEHAKEPSQIVVSGLSIQ
jgi:thiol-disulfide isomerase/thioredoxin